MPSSQTSSSDIVVGFLGGFVRHDEPHHPEVQLIQDLRQEYPKQVYIGLFENLKVGVAYNTILKLSVTGMPARSNFRDRLTTAEAPQLCPNNTMRARRFLSSDSASPSFVPSSG